jgi:hypothetical protein
MRLFADSLAERFRPQGIDAITSPIARIRAVIEHQQKQIGSPHEFAEALIEFAFRSLRLAHRQTHGNEKSDEKPIAWEDARRAVFQIANAMFEIDRLLALTRANNRYLVVKLIRGTNTLHAYEGVPPVRPGELIELTEAQIRALKHITFDLGDHKLLNE